MSAVSKEPLRPSQITKDKLSVTKRELEKKYKNGAMERLAKERFQGTTVGEYKKLITQQRKSPKEFKTIAVIGRGAFGEVRLVREKSTGNIYAMKILKKSEMLKKNQVAHVISERNVMAKTQSDWIVQLICSFQDDENLYLVMEFLPGGDMMTWLINKVVFTEEQTRFYMAQLIMAVDSVHQSGYVHRDLKPDNILLDKFGHIKLSDFGLSKPMEADPMDVDFEKEVAAAMNASPFTPPSTTTSNTSSTSTTTSTSSPSTPASSSTGNLPQQLPAMTTKEKVATWKKYGRIIMWSMVGSNGYIAPEVLTKKGYGIECDWWSLGVIMFEMLCGFPPFYAETPYQTCQKIVRWKEFLEFPEDIPVSPAAEDLIRRLLCDAKNRLGSNLGVDEIKTHPFFKGVDWSKVRNPAVNKAPFVPTLSSDEDVRYFDKFESDDLYKTMKSEYEKRFPNMFADKNHVFMGFSFQRQKQQQPKKKAKPSLDDLFATGDDDGGGSSDQTDEKTQ